MWEVLVVYCRTGKAAGNRSLGNGFNKGLFKGQGITQYLASTKKVDKQIDDILVQHIILFGYAVRCQFFGLRSTPGRRGRRSGRPDGERYSAGEEGRRKRKSGIPSPGRLPDGPDRRRGRGRRREAAGTGPAPRRTASSAGGL